MEKLRIVPARMNDVHVLSQMNQELIEDEKSENPMTLAELTERMIGFLNAEWRAVLFVLDDRIVGYALYKEEDLTSKEQGQSIYIRQYYISRSDRGQGLGRQGLSQLKTELFKDKAISIDVLESNPNGKRFWESLGFTPYFTNMYLKS